MELMHLPSALILLSQKVENPESKARLDLPGWAEVMPGLSPLRCFATLLSQVVECWVAILKPIPELSPLGHGKQTPACPWAPHSVLQVPWPETYFTKPAEHRNSPFYPHFHSMFSFLHLWLNKPVRSHARAARNFSFCLGFVTVFTLRAAHPQVRQVLHMGLLSPHSSALALLGSEGHIPAALTAPRAVSCCWVTHRGETEAWLGLWLLQQGDLPPLHVILKG